MKRILHVVDKLSVGDATIHGVTRLLAWWLPRFNKKEFSVSICSLRSKDKAGEYLESLGIKVFYLNRGKFSPLTLIDLLRLTKKHAFDLLHLHGYGATTFGRICSRVTGSPNVVHEHMFDYGMPFYQKLADKLTSKLTDKAIAVSGGVKKFLSQFRSLPEGKIAVIYNGIPLDEYRTLGGENASAADKGLRNDLGIPNSHAVVGTVGRLHEIKGQMYFLNAAHKVLRGYRNVTFLVVGDGGMMQSLKEHCSKIGIADSVIFTGYREDVASILRIMDIKIIPSLSEGGPLTLFEAMAAGCAIVATDIGALASEVIENGRTGFLVPSKNSNAIAEKISILIEDPIFREKMVSAGLIASKNFDVNYTVKQIEQCYHELLRVNSRRGWTTRKKQS